jgi:hypothetical protein
MMGGCAVLIWTSLLLYSLTVRSVKMAVQSWSQILPTDKRDPEARLGKPWEMVADAGRLGNGRWAVDLDVMICPLGTMTLTEGFEAEVGRWSI